LAEDLVEDCQESVGYVGHIQSREAAQKLSEQTAAWVRCYVENDLIQVDIEAEYR
jgi:hypothetical protein